MTHYVVYDVFTDQPFGGNQLAVFPDATAIPESDLQSIAREFNFSEVTFVYPPDNKTHTAKIRIFTPTSEIKFAGHPIIGTAIALADKGAVGPFTFELGIGPLVCCVDGKDAMFTTTAPLERLAEPDVALVAQVLNLQPSDIAITTHAPIQASLGLPFVLVEVTDRAVLSKASPDTATMRKAAALYPAGLDFATFVYCRTDNHIDARMFAPLDNIPEDPATGSASATLAALLHEVLGTPVDLSIHQGDDMGRPSRIAAKTLAGDQLSVQISGSAVQTMSGQLTYAKGGPT